MYNKRFQGGSIQHVVYNYSETNLRKAPEDRALLADVATTGMAFDNIVTASVGVARVISALKLETTIEGSGSEVAVLVHCIKLVKWGSANTCSIASLTATIVANGSGTTVADASLVAGCDGPSIGSMNIGTAIGTRCSRLDFLPVVVVDGVEVSTGVVPLLDRLVPASGGGPSGTSGDVTKLEGSDSADITAVLKSSFDKSLRRPCRCYLLLNGNDTRQSSPPSFIAILTALAVCCHLKLWRQNLQLAKTTLILLTKTNTTQRLRAVVLFQRMKARTRPSWNEVMPTNHLLLRALSYGPRGGWTFMSHSWHTYSVLASARLRDTRLESINTASKYARSCLLVFLCNRTCDYWNLIGHLHIQACVSVTVPEWPDPPSVCWWCNTSSAVKREWSGQQD